MASARDVEKQYLPIPRTDEGMQIENSEEHSENVKLARDGIRESNSNVTVERDLHSRKQPLQTHDFGRKKSENVWRNWRATAASGLRMYRADAKLRGRHGLQETELRSPVTSAI
jgi:hypothetical protein